MNIRQICQPARCAVEVWRDGGERTLVEGYLHEMTVI